MSKSGEAIQRRALRIIFPDTAGMPYIFALGYAQIPSPHSRRQKANKEFLKSMTLPPVLSPSSHHAEMVLLLPD